MQMMWSTMVALVQISSMQQRYDCRFAEAMCMYELTNVRSTYTNEWDVRYHCTCKMQRPDNLWPLRTYGAFLSTHTSLSDANRCRNLYILPIREIGIVGVT